MSVPAELRITVEGTCNSGKSTILRLIEETLRAQGFENITVNDFVGQAPSPKWREDQTKRLAWLRDARHLQVQLRVKQIGRREEL